MSQSLNSPTYTPMETLAFRVRQLRARKEWTATQLGNALTANGVPWDRFTVKALENGKRKNVTVIEFLALAAVLDVAPVHLLFPLQDGMYEITPDGDGVEDISIDRARWWFQGINPLPETNRQTYFSERPVEQLSVNDRSMDISLERARNDDGEFFDRVMRFETSLDNELSKSDEEMIKNFLRLKESDHKELKKKDALRLEGYATNDSEENDTDGSE